MAYVDSGFKKHTHPQQTDSITDSMFTGLKIPWMDDENENNSYKELSHKITILHNYGPITWLPKICDESPSRRG